MVDMMDKMLDQGLSPNPDELGLPVDFRLTRRDGLEKPAQPSRSVLFFGRYTDRATRHAISELVLYDGRLRALSRWLGKGAK